MDAKRHPALRMAESNTQDNAQPCIGWCHHYSPHMGLGSSRPADALAVWAEGELCLWNEAEGSRTALPDINMFGTALKKRSKWNRRPK